MPTHTHTHCTYPQTEHQVDIRDLHYKTFWRSSNRISDPLIARRSIALPRQYTLAAYNIYLVISRAICEKYPAVVDRIFDFLDFTRGVERVQRERTGLLRKVGD